ncbi:anthranilate synthase component I [Rhodobacteraceae bacterium]|nr:anthranilate synthase component I [Paracoccaceae bacterium]RCL81261.1 MAG: anthranilate synthase component I [Paracoccaceae bacterium]
MTVSPNFSDFQKEYEAGRNQVVFSKLTSDLETPVSIMLKLAGAKKNSFILESVTGGETRGRYSIIGMEPDLIWKCEGNHSFHSSGKDEFTNIKGNPLTVFRNILEQSKINLPDDLPQASAGLFGYFGYDMVRHVEDLPNINPDKIGLPDAMFIRPTIIAVLDGVKGEVILVSPVFCDTQTSCKIAYERAQSKISKAVFELKKQIITNRNLGKSGKIEEPSSNLTKEEYKSAVKKAKAYIKQGDIFQVVPSQRWTQSFSYSPFSLYRSLRRTNPSPFMFFFNFGNFQVIGASPEILVRVFGNEVTIRPIAGTRPRGATPEEDKALEADLLADKKELAEHLMLLDLGRNDIGRVAKIGTVKPTEKFIIERYSHVMHIVSNVVGELSDEHDAVSAFFAGMPAGTVSGAPKVRAMEIIDELEPEKRGVYGGGVGYFSSGGDMDMCIALRTAVLKDEKLYIQAGGGVVFDSDPEVEYMETVHKSNAIRKAAADAAMFEN